MGLSAVTVPQDVATLHHNSKNKKRHDTGRMSGADI
jgi:hypothetical protein